MPFGFTRWIYHLSVKEFLRHILPLRHIFHNPKRFLKKPFSTHRITQAKAAFLKGKSSLILSQMCTSIPTHLMIHYMLENWVLPHSHPFHQTPSRRYPIHQFEPHISCLTPIELVCLCVCIHNFLWNFKILTSALTIPMYSLTGAMLNPQRLV